MSLIKIKGKYYGENDPVSMTAREFYDELTEKSDNSIVGVLTIGLAVVTIIGVGHISWREEYKHKNRPTIIVDKDQNKATIFNAPGEQGNEGFEITPSPIEDGNDTFKYVAKNGVKVTGYIRTGEGDKYKEDVKGTLTEVIDEAAKLVGADGTIEIINVNNGKARTLIKK